MTTELEIEDLADVIREQNDPLDIRMQYMDNSEILLDSRTLKPKYLDYLTDEERKEEQLWNKVEAGGVDAVLSCRELLAKKPTETREIVRYVDLSANQKLKFVVCDRERIHWLTMAGLARNAADEAMMWDSEQEAEKARSQYLRAVAENCVPLVVERLVVG